MANICLILGKTGTGKSTSIKGLNPKETVIFNVLKKRLPFKGSKSIYNEEKENYTGGNKLYVTQNASEYFAESYRDYVTRSTELKTKRPKTYAYLTRVLNML